MADIIGIPIIPGQPVVIRMNGKCEEFNYPVSLKKRDKWSDVVVTCWQNGSVNIESRTCNVGKEGSGKRTNTCTLTSEQEKIIFCMKEVCNEKPKKAR